MFEKMKQLMDMRRMAQEAERRLGDLRIETSGLGGKVKVVVDGTHKVHALSVDESLLSAGQRPSLEKALTALLNESADSVKREAAAQAMEMMKGMNLPGG